jgi:hypothetical protein
MFEDDEVDWAGLPAGPELAAALERVDLTRLSGYVLVEVIRASERLRSWSMAVQCEAMAQLAHCADEALLETSPTPGARTNAINDVAVDEIATALRIARPTAAHRLDVALTLTDRLPATLSALRSGTIHDGQARVVCQHTAVLPSADAASRTILREVERRVLTDAAELTPGRLRALVDRCVHRADPQAASKRHKRAVTERRVEVWPQPDGMAILAAMLPADQAHAAFAMIDACARALGAHDPRGMDARRADCLVDLIASRGAEAFQTDTNRTDVGSDEPTAANEPAANDGSRAAEAAPWAPDGPDPAGRFRRPAQTIVHITVPISTLMGVADEPGELAGYGPVPAELARQIAADPNSVWRRLLTDPASGTLLDYGTTTYRPPAGLDRHVRARDGTCRFPGCRQSAWKCDLDHGVPHPDGPTSECNLAGLCRYHHDLKTSGRWHLRHGPGAVLTWTSPTGHRYQTAPATLDPAAETDPLPATTEPKDAHSISDQKRPEAA